jgi:hypothetical protein
MRSKALCGGGRMRCRWPISGRAIGLGGSLLLLRLLHLEMTRVESARRSRTPGSRARPPPPPPLAAAAAASIVISALLCTALVVSYGVAVWLVTLAVLL